jgi:hypothetical protein
MEANIGRQFRWKFNRPKDGGTFDRIRLYFYWLWTKTRVSSMTRLQK